MPAGRRRTRVPFLAPDLPREVALLRVVVPALVQIALVLVQVTTVLVLVTTVLVLAGSLVMQVAWGAM